MPIVPDTKDWTWVLERPCAECGFDAATVSVTDIASLIRENAAAWDALLARNIELRERPTDDQWSPLEYACHVRDVFRLYHERLQLMLTQDDPSYPNWDQDDTAVAQQYNEQDPTTVATELESAAQRLADAFAGVRDQQWQRTGTRSDGARFTVESFARYLIHDPVHHLHDVGG